MKSEVFKRELNYIEDSRIKSNAEILLNNLPDYFYRIKASSTGKYHPLFAQEDQGLVKHVKVAVHFATLLFQIYKFDSHTKDIIIVSLLIHDGLKKGFEEEKYTRVDHPLLIRKLLKRLQNSLTLTIEEIEEIATNVESHMGRWNTNPYSEVILPLPITVTQKFIHMCDFLASRKSINFSFDDQCNIKEAE